MTGRGRKRGNTDHFWFWRTYRQTLSERAPGVGMYADIFNSLKENA